MKTITEEEKKAIDFLNLTNTSFITRFKTHDFYFPDDKEQRDVYNITLTNNLHRYRFTFGPSTADTGKIPTPYDVLTCLHKSHPGNFEEFCMEYDYDSDSRKAYKTYKEVMKCWKNVELLFTPEQIELLQEIQ